MGNLIHINRPCPDTICLKRYECPTCKKRRYFVVWHVPWYGVTLVCLRCGERFDAEEGRLPRPFMRGWRQESIKSVKKLWRKYVGKKELGISDEQKATENNDC